jgi:hypothetical protein
MLIETRLEGVQKKMAKVEGNISKPYRSDRTYAGRNWRSLPFRAVFYCSYGNENFSWYAYL